MSPPFGLSYFALYALLLAFIMTLLALASYRSYEITKKRLKQKEAELNQLQSGAVEFRQKTTEAFADQKALRLHAENLERSLTMANEEIDKERKQTERLRNDLDQLRTEYAATKMNLAEAYKILREKSQA